MVTTNQESVRRCHRCRDSRSESVSARGGPLRRARRRIAPSRPRTSAKARKSPPRAVANALTSRMNCVGSKDSPPGAGSHRVVFPLALESTLALRDLTRPLDLPVRPFAVELALIFRHGSTPGISLRSGQSSTWSPCPARLRLPGDPSSLASRSCGCSTHWGEASRRWFPSGEALLVSRMLASHEENVRVHAQCAPWPAAAPSKAFAALLQDGSLPHVRPCALAESRFLAGLRSRMKYTP